MSPSPEGVIWLLSSLIVHTYLFSGSLFCKLEFPPTAKDSNSMSSTQGYHCALTGFPLTLLKPANSPQTIICSNIRIHSLRIPDLGCLTTNVWKYVFIYLGLLTVYLGKVNQITITLSWPEAEIVSRDFYQLEISQSITLACSNNNIMLIWLVNTKQPALLMP